ncbi:rhodanese-like domain-containing protein [Oceanobacillus sp. FSL W7-1281]|uniref:rhodanese-like domain-containing protein n=1 Tax=Oceanobacillus sp. FSL W7-1281 TaxID=2921698 RepID=UPI0030D7B15A
MADIKELTPAEVDTIRENDNIQLIDVREDEEVAQGIIENALHIPLGDIPAAYEELDRDKEYIMICRSGRRSHNATAFLQEQGFNVSNMSGGMLEWDGEIIIK